MIFMVFFDNSHDSILKIELYTFQVAPLFLTNLNIYFHHLVSHLIIKKLCLFHLKKINKLIDKVGYRYLFQRLFFAF
jgi:hypothetical protein